MTETDTDSLSADALVEMNPMYLLRWEPSQDAHVLLYPEGVVKLNDTAGEILTYCTGERSVAEIAAAIDAGYGDDVRERVLNFLEVAYAKGWIRTKS